METPYTTLMLTFDRSKREHLKNYCYQGNLIAKINRKYELLAFNEEVDPRLKVRYEVQALSGFADNFLIIGLLEREAEDYTSEEERRVVSRGFRPLRGDFVGVYVDGPGRRIQFQVNHFVVQEVEITPELCRLEFIPYLMIYKPGDVLKINYSLED